MFYPMFRYGGQHVSYLLSFIGKTVRINRGGPESIIGRLIAVHADYIVLLTKDGIVYANTAHIKSITESKSVQTVGRRTGGRQLGYIMAPSFHDVLRRLTKHFVQINQGGPEKVTGFIVEVGPDTLLLVSGKEVIRIPLFHIRTVSLAQRSGSRNGSSDYQSRDSYQRSQGQRSGGRYGSGDDKSKDGKQRSQGQRSDSAQGGGSKGRQGGRDAGGSAGRKR